MMRHDRKILHNVTFTFIVAVCAFFYLRSRKLTFEDNVGNNKMYEAIYDFESGDFNAALDGTSEHEGFFYIINNFKGTNVCNLATFYAGISLMNLKEYNCALRYLIKARIGEPIFEAKRLAAIGDIYVELDRCKDAVNYFIRAANVYKNDEDNASFLFKAVLAYEALDDYGSALKVIAKYLDSNNKINDKTYEKFSKEKIRLEARLKSK